MVTSELVDMWVGIGLFVAFIVFMGFIGPRLNIEWLPAKRRREAYWAQREAERQQHLEEHARLRHEKGLE